MKSSISNLIRRLATSAKSRFTLVLVIIVTSMTSLYAQEYASSQTNSHIDDSFLTVTVVGSVTDPDNATLTPDANYALLSSEGIRATSLVRLSAQAILTLTLPSNVAAGKHSYVRVDAPTQTGLNLDLGELVNLLGLLANNTIKVTTNAGTAQKHFVKDAAGNLYIQVTSSQAYNSITINLDLGGSTNTLGSVLALGTLRLRVYHVVTYENAAFTPCQAIPFAFAGTDPQATGIDITLSDALQNPERAIDGIVSLTNYSLLQNGNVGAVSTVRQTIYLGKTSPGSNQVLATISRPALLLDLTVLSGISIQAFNGSTAAGASQSISSLLLGLSLLDFTNNNLATVAFTPGVAFDRVVITSVGVADVFTGLRLHELSSRPPIAFSGGRVSGGTAGLSISSDIKIAIANVTPVSLPGFSIACGAPDDFTYSLYQVDQSGARVLGGTLPPSFVLNSDGTLTGSPEVDENDTYIFDVQAANIYGQSAFTTFVITIDANLPVTLVKFDAVAEGQTASLNWSTSTETNSDRFEIERSPSGKNWLKIGTVSSNHESASFNHYSFVDSKPLDGQNLYRLKMVDFDDTFTYSHLESVNFAASAFVYPNPVNGTENLNINMTDWAKVKSVKVVTAAGKTVFEASTALSAGINTKNLSAGSYFVKMIHTDGTVSTHKFVRQ